MPRRVRAKSYLTGSSGRTRLKARVSSRAVVMSALLRDVAPSSRPMRSMCTSSGTISIAGATSLQSPTSTRSRRTIHRKKRFSRLQALDRAGSGRRWPALPPEPSISSPANRPSAGMTVSSPRAREAAKKG